MSAAPLPNGESRRPERDSRGRFVYHPGPGNPHARAAGELRSALLRAVTADDIEAIITKLIETAKQGDVIASREILDRTIGKAVASDLLARLEAIENALEEKRG